MFLAGCGGGKTGEQPQLVQGDGFRFTAPPGWQVQHTRTASLARHGALDVVEVFVFKTQKEYRTALFPKLPQELDRVSASLAKKLGGHVVSRRQVVVDGRKAWSYRTASHKSYEQITFVFEGRKEYELLCQRAEGEDDLPCAQLLTSFALS